MFKVISKFKPSGDQPRAIEKLSNNIKKGVKHNILLGVTGSGKTFTIAKIIEKVNLPTLVISPNKTLAAQLYQEFKEFFPKNSVHYFVSYYDYYQPEAYIPQTDTYIEKDAKINKIIDQLRHSAVQALLSRDDVIIVASVSCIYNLGSPDSYQRVSLQLKKGEKISRKKILEALASLQYQRNETDLTPGNFRVKGEVIDIMLVTGEAMIRLEFWGEEIDRILKFKDPLNLSLSQELEEIRIYPAQFWVTEEQKLKTAIYNIELELQERLKELKSQGKLLEAERLEKRTKYDLEMLAETGYCHGIENYSRHLEFREPGSPPFTLIDYFAQKGKFLTFIDESHLTCPQLKAMAIQDRRRKETLIEYGFRLPSCIDNRPLTYEEFEQKTQVLVYVSATPGKIELFQTKKENVVEQLIRPTGLLEPKVEIRPTKNQLKDVIKETEKRIKKRERVLILTLTKRLAEAIAEHLLEKGIKAHYLHSDIKTLERPEILNKLRRGEFEAIVGINLLREGLDLPEVSLVAILDADKEGFLRSETTLIQIIGRAARHIEGKAILYADKVTKSMQKAIKEIERRRKIQLEYNLKHKITPAPIKKPIREWEFMRIHQKAVKTELEKIKDVNLLKEELKVAVENLDFERAIVIRELIKKLEKTPKVK